MEPGERYWQLVEPHCERVSIYDGPEVFLREFDRIPEGARNLLAGHWCQSEVCNGGFHQFFWNSTGVLSPEAAHAFEAIGLPQLASLVRSAMSFFGQEYLRDRDQRVAILDQYADRHPDAQDPFGEFDGQFYELLSQEAGGWHKAADEYAKAYGG